MKKERGITLTALVITIIIILILAGITLGTITGENGLIEKAKKATESYKEASEKENEDMDILTERIGDIEKNTGTGGSSTLASESVYYKKIGEDTIPIPKGFYYVGGTKESGVVISDNKEDEDVYANTENGDVPSGADEDAYDDSGKIIEEKLKIKGNQFVFIPCELKNYKKIDFGMTSANSWEKCTDAAELLQIKKYGGFYVGRFEAGISNITLNSKNIAWEESLTSAGWQDTSFTSDKVTGKITERPRRNTLLSCRI